MSSPSPSHFLKVFTFISFWASCIPALAQNPTLTEALDEPALQWTTSGDVNFVGTQSDDSPSEDAAIATLAEGQAASLTTTLPGPGIIDFWIGGAESLEDWTATLDGVVLELSPGTWPYGFKASGPGEHTLSITCTSSSSEEVEAFVDGVIFMPDREVSLKDALDSPDQTWTTSETTPWVGSPYFSSDGSDAAWSRLLAEDEVTYLETTVTGPKEISFWWRKTFRSRTNGEFLVNGEKVVEARLASSDQWGKFTYILGPGTHSLRWEAEQWGDAITDPRSPAEGLWLDQFQVSPLQNSALQAFSTPSPGASLRGSDIPVEPGHDGGIALAFPATRNESPLLTLPLEPAPGSGLRRLSFWAKGTAFGSAIAGYKRQWGETEDWIKIEAYVPPDLSEMTITAENQWEEDVSICVIDGLLIEDVETLPLADANLGPLASQFLSDGWYGWAPDDNTDVPVAASVTNSSELTGTIEGPGWLRFDASVDYNGYIMLSIGDKNVIAVTSDSASNSFEYPIPAGSHAVTFKHNTVNYTRPLATLSNLRFDPFSPLSLAEALGAPGQTFDTSLSLYNNDPEAPEHFTTSPFFGTENDGVVGVAASGQSLNLSTQVTGPAIVSFRWHTSEPFLSPQLPEWIRDTGGIVTGTVGGLGLDYFMPRFVIDGILAGPAETAFYHFCDSPHIQPTEPFDPSDPTSTSDGCSLLLGKEQNSNPTGWLQQSLYLPPGVHSLEWSTGLPPLDYDTIAWRQLSIADLTITPVAEKYAAWASEQWIANPEVTSASAKLGPWQDPNADPDQDGVTNAMEFAFRTNPRVNTDKPADAIVSSENNQLSALWTGLRQNEPGLTLIPELSTDLETWTLAPESVEHLQTTEGLRVWAKDETLKSAFFRLDVDVTTR